MNTEIKRFNLNTLSNIIQHYHDAQEKQPHFCDRLIDPEAPEVEEKFLARSRRAMSINAARGDLLAIEILACEVLEMMLEIQKQNYDAAIEEAYDAIAVLLRTIDEIKKARSEATVEKMKEEDEK